MTAIFAYVKGGCAIIAADTLRVDVMKLFPPQTVKKVFSWAGCILFAAAGNGPRLERLAAAVISEQGSSSPDEIGFLAAFHKHQAAHYAAATSGTSLVTKVPGLSQGSYLVAVPELNGVPAHLFELDFATGCQTSLNSHSWAQGTDPSAFQVIAKSVLANYPAGAAIPGDLWGSECIRQAISLHPNAVGLPFEVGISKKSVNGSHSAQMTRHSSHPTTGDPTFEI